jgi:hypothetical protein
VWRLARKPAFAAIGVLAAAPTLAAFGVYVWLFVRSMNRHHWALEHLIALLYLWQTQTGAAFALAAAGLGAIVILHQTGSTRRLEEMRRERRAAALRAMLPLDLMELITYAATCARMFARYVVRGKTLAVEAILTFPHCQTWPPEYQSFNGSTEPLKFILNRTSLVLTEYRYKQDFSEPVPNPPRRWLSDDVWRCRIAQKQF